MKRVATGHPDREIHVVADNLDTCPLFGTAHNQLSNRVKKSLVKAVLVEH